MRKLTGIGALIFICIAGWQIGEGMTPGSLNMALGVCFGMMGGIPAALIALAGSNRRVDVYHHTIAETSPQSAVQPTAITVQPERWFVVEPSATRQRIEVTR